MMEVKATAATPMAMTTSVRLKAALLCSVSVNLAELRRVRKCKGAKPRLSLGGVLICEGNFKKKVSSLAEVA